MKNKSILRRRALIVCMCVFMSVVFTGCGLFGKKDDAEATQDMSAEDISGDPSAESPDGTDPYATEPTTEDYASDAEGSFATPVEETPTVEDEAPAETTVPQGGPEAKKTKNLEALTGTYADFVTGLDDTEYYALVTTADGKDVLLVAQDVTTRGTDEYFAYECDVYFFDGTGYTQLGRIVSDKDNDCIIEMTEDGYVLVAGGTADSYPYQFMKIKIDTTGQQLTAYECDTQTDATSYTYISEDTGNIEQPANDDGAQFNIIKSIYDDSVNHGIYFTPKAPKY